MKVGPIAESPDLGFDGPVVHVELCGMAGSPDDSETEALGFQSVLNALPHVRMIPPAEESRLIRQVKEAQ